MDPLLRNNLIIIVLFGVVCHVIYHKLEPRQPPWHFIFLVAVPLSTSPLLRPFFTSSVSAALVAWSLYLATLVAFTIIYRVSPFHPLARYPGPVMCKVTKIWFAVASLGGKQHIHYQDLHRRYGDVVRIGPNELSFCTPDAIVPMMGVGGMPKAEYWDGQFVDQKKYRSLVGIRNPYQHMQLRRRWSRAFSPEALRLYRPLLERRVNQLIESLAQRVGSPLDLAKWLSWFSYDVMNDIVFGSGTELMLNEDAGLVWELMEDAQPAANFLGHVPWMAELSLWIPGVAQTLKEFRNHSYERVMKRYHQGSPNKDLFYYLIDEAGVEPERPDFDQIASDASLAIVAGSDTISPALSNLFYFLLRNPAAYTKLQAEIDDANTSIYDTNAQAHLPYLNAVISETLRLLPPVPVGSIRAPLIGGGGHKIGAHFLPEGTTAVIHTYSLHRDERNFSAVPEEFLPERWLPQEKQILLEASHSKDRGKLVHNPSAFIPFSFGPADCIGKRLALQEIRMVVCGILRHFQLMFAEDYDPASWEADMCDYFVIRKGRLRVVITRRAEVQLY